MTKIAATKITITRAEGPHALCGHKQMFEGPDSWAEASAWLRSQGHTFPAKGGYDKHDFVVTFANGDTWDGRLDCKHPSCDGADLDVAKHVLETAQFYAGLRCPAHLTRECYEGLLKRPEYAEAGERMRGFLATFEVPADRGPTTSNPGLPERAAQAS